MASIKMGLQLLETITSALYDDPIILFREYVQNSVDAYNMEVSKNKERKLNDFCIDIDIDTNGRNIFIRDNGYAIPATKFIEKMTNIGASDKSKYHNQIGFRGIGRLSAMPFCQKLVFKNKPKGSDKIYIYTWDGTKFNEMLNQDTDQELNDAIGKISDNSSQLCPSTEKDMHYFTVEIQGYDEEIANLVTQYNFADKLRMTLPLKYDPQFEEGEKILDKYQEFMNYSLDRFSFIVKYNGEVLYKPYQKLHILEAGIHFWELRYPTKMKDELGSKLGLLWFTFDRKIAAKPQNSPYGILVRSKNMLVGDQNALATALFRAKSDTRGYVATYRELTQTLQGVYGEMLIDTTKLKDNARRDWFKFDTASMNLRDIISEFMKRLYDYRSIASKAFNAIESDKNAQKLIKAFSDLTSDYDPLKFANAFFDAKRKFDESKTNEILEFADEDIPRSTITIKRYYEKIMKLIRDFFTNNQDLQNFIKLRAYLKKQLNQENQK